MSSDLHVHSLWPATRPGDTDIGYAVDAARRRTALIVLPLGFGAAALAFLLPHPIGLVLASLAVLTGLWAGMQMGSRGGFYEIDPGGRPSTFLGQQPPDLSGRTRGRPR